MFSFFSIFSHKSWNSFSGLKKCLDWYPPLFENFTPQTSIVARQTIEETIQQFEPRAQLINIQISASPDSNYMFVSILFNLINNKDEQVLNLELARIR